MQEFFEPLKELIEEIEQYLASHPLAGYFIFKIFDLILAKTIPHIKRKANNAWNYLWYYIYKLEFYIKYCVVPKIM